MWILFRLLVSILSFWQGHKKLNQFEALDFYLMVENTILFLIMGGGAPIGQDSIFYSISFRLPFQLTLISVFWYCTVLQVILII